ncbi:MAG: hypothetical protein ACFCUE_10700 [Candidatus Bathyarchaeia archaeon]
MASRSEENYPIKKDAVKPTGETSFNRTAGTKGGPGKRSRSRNRPKRENKNVL